MKVLQVNRLEEKYIQYDISTETENFYVRVGDKYVLIHNSPSIICGINPENGKFFVGTKGAFAKTPKLNYTNADIDKNHPNPGLNDKLKLALKYLPELNIREIIQGDMMFTQADLSRENIDGQTYVTFRPNTITYAIPENSNLADRIKTAKIGIVFHTSYSGKSIEDAKASFNVDIGKLNSNTKNVWFRDASFVDASGTATFTETETDQINKLLSQAGSLFRTISAKTLNQIAISDTYKIQIKSWNNMKVREGKQITNTATHTRDMINHIEQSLNQNIIDAKKNDTKLRRTKEKNIIISFYKNNRNELKKIFDLQNIIVDIKSLIIRKLEQIKDVGTFIKTDDGYKVTAPEGFVVVDQLSNKALKIVDRLEFSHANFNVAKNWSK